MTYEIPNQQEAEAIKQVKTFLRIIMWVLLFILLLGIYGDWLLHSIMPPTPSWWKYLILIVISPLLFILYVIPSSVFYASQSSFWVLWVVGLSACTWLWIISQRGWIERTASCVPLGLLVIAPFAVTEMYAYMPLASVGVEQGYEMNWLTQPKGYLGVAFRRVQFEIDDYHYDREYKLYGWSEDNKLYYGSYGSHGRNGLWQYDPVSGDKPRRIRSLPDDFVPSTTISLLSLRHPSSVLRPRQPIGEGVTRWNPRTIEESISPDGMMRAAVIHDASVLHLEVIVTQPADP